MVLESSPGYSRPELSAGTITYHNTATAAIASPKSLVRPLKASTRNTTIAIAQRIHCVVRHCISTSLPIALCFSLFAFRQKPAFLEDLVVQFVPCGLFSPTNNQGLRVKAKNEGEQRLSSSIRLSFISPISPRSHSKADKGESNERFHVSPSRSRIRSQADGIQRQLSQVKGRQECRQHLQSVRQQEQWNPQSRAERHW